MLPHMSGQMGAADMAVGFVGCFGVPLQGLFQKKRGLKALSHKAGTKERDWSWRPGENRGFSAWQSVSRNASFPFGFPLNAKQKKSTWLKGQDSEWPPLKRFSKSYDQNAKDGHFVPQQTPFANYFCPMCGFCTQPAQRTNSEAKNTSTHTRTHNDHPFQI